MTRPIIGIIGKVQPQYEEDIWHRIDEDGNKNPYIINFILKSNNDSQSCKISKEEEKRVKKQDINFIDIKDKNILCEVKSFQRLKIFEKDEDLFRSKKQLEYIIVRIVTNYDNDISLDIAVWEKISKFLYSLATHDRYRISRGNIWNRIKGKYIKEFYEILLLFYKNKK